MRPAESTPDQGGGCTEDLAARLPENPRDALEALYLRVAPALHAWAAIRIPGSLAGRLDPAEVLQEAWLRAVELSPSFVPGTTPFRPWIFRIAGYVLLESFRRTARHGTGGAGTGDSQVSFGGIPAPITTVSRQVARDEELRSLIDEARFLSDDERRLLLFRGLEGLSYEVVGERLGITPATAMKRWQRLREGLAGRLSSRGILVEA